MSLVLQEKLGGEILEVDLAGKLSKSDYERFVPHAEQLIREHGKLKLLVSMHEFDGWTLGGFWEDMKFDAKHFRDIKKIAFVGDEKWEKGMSTFCKPFTSAEIKFFPSEQIDQARQWLNS
jgi:hypothetical protein